jgi:hypothetical protein
MFPPTPLTVSPPLNGRCFCRQCSLCFRGCCHLQTTMVMTCCSAKSSVLVKILLNRKSILVKRHTSMARRREHLSVYLRICVSGQEQNHKKIKKNQERIIRHRLNKNVPAGSNAYLCICIFSKEITALDPFCQYRIRGTIRGTIYCTFNHTSNCTQNLLKIAIFEEVLSMICGTILRYDFSPPQHTTTKMSRRHLTLQRLCPLYPWVGQLRPQILAP